MGLHCLPSYLFMVEQVHAWPVAKRDTGHTFLSTSAIQRPMSQI